jgi:hypothetical protein
MCLPCLSLIKKKQPVQKLLARTVKIPSAKPAVLRIVLRKSLVRVSWINFYIYGNNSWVQESIGLCYSTACYWKHPVEEEIKEERRVISLSAQ